MRERFHIFSNGSVHVAFDSTNMAFYRLTDEAWEKAQKHGISKLSDFFPSAAAKNNVNTIQPRENALGLERLVLIVTTKCNLRCRYCYADSGTYGMVKEHMTPQTAHRILDRMLDLFHVIGTIQFFGGEPSFNLKTIKATCEDIASRHVSGRLKQLPRYGLVTNATFLPSKLADLVGQYHIHVTCSIDGPPQVHNANRIDFRGKGTYQKAIQNFKKLRECGISLGVEMTFSPQAMAVGYDVTSLISASLN